MPAPADAVDASPLVFEVIVFFADIDTEFWALMELCQDTSAIAELLIIEIATAASTEVST